MQVEQKMEPCTVNSLSKGGCFLYLIIAEILMMNILEVLALSGEGRDNVVDWRED